MFIIAIFFFVGGLTGFILVYSTDIPSLDPRLFNFKETTIVYDEAGMELARLHGEENRIFVPLDFIPEHVKQAFIAIEDDRFYQHRGFNPAGIIRAAHINYTEGSIRQGASTITQQLIRTVYLTNERTIKRKLHEVILAIKMEQWYSKERILELYLNSIYFGNGAYGVEAASETYFGKSVSELSIAEGAMLAGMANSPNNNNPFRSYENAILRKNTVIDRMYRLGFISLREARETREPDLIVLNTPPEAAYPFPYFLDYALHHELITILSSPSLFSNREYAYQALYTLGLRIHTTVNQEIQDKAEAILNDSSNYPATHYIDMNKFIQDYRKNSNRIPAGFPGNYTDADGVPQPQAAVVLCNPKNGEIIAMAGGREHRRGTNEVLRYLSLRQPGSAIKPLIVFAPALETGLVDETSYLPDNPVTIGDWTPNNWDYRYWGNISLRDALVYSRNIPAVTLLHELSVPIGIEYAEKMGISTFSRRDMHSPAVALGGVSGVRVLDMAQAYAVLANNGRKQPLHTIRKIEDTAGNIIYEYEKEPEQILSRQTVNIINDILEETHRVFIGNKILSDRPVSAKTGTTDDNRDAYLAAYTADLVAVLWMGYDYKKMGRIPAGHEYSCRIVRSIMEKAIER